MIAFWNWKAVDSAFPKYINEARGTGWGVWWCGEINILTSAAATEAVVAGAGSDGREPRGASLEAASAGRFCLFWLGVA